MAIYHLRLKLITRSATLSSVVAAAAYRSGQTLYDDSLGRSFQYDKPDVVYTEIIAPERSPDWVFDRQKLWNFVTAAERRVDAQLSRGCELTLPRELDRQSQIALVRAFVRDMFVKEGMVADIAIHEPEGADGKKQPHAHVLLTLRELDPVSPTGFDAKKNRDWNEREEVFREVAEARKRFNRTGSAEDKAALKEAQAKRNVNVWRKAWADYANAALEEAGSAARIDHRTLEAQGIQRAPQSSLGLARHMVEKAYDYLKDRVTQWVAVRKRASLYAEVEHMRQQSPDTLFAFVMQINDLAESFAASFRKQPNIPETPLEPGR